MFDLKFFLKDDLVSPLAILLDPTDNYRQTGRSELFAKAYIVIAYRHPFEWIKIQDHLVGRNKQEMERNMVDIINQLINSIYMDFRFKGDYEIRYMPKNVGEPLEDLFINPEIVKDFKLNEKYR